VDIKRHSGIQHGHTGLARALASLLLVFMLYGTTVEAAHRHGRLLNPAERNASASLSGSNHETQTAGATLDCSDCLICQLHQNFASGLVTFRMADSPDAASSRVTTSAPVLSLSHSPITRAGRAPPIAN
jgi:hypothetical protein